MIENFEQSENAMAFKGTLFYKISLGSVLTAK